MPASLLSRVAVERHLAAVQAELGQADKKRLAALPPLIGDDRRVRLSDMLSALFPEQDRSASLTSFRQFRGRIAAAAADAKVRLTLDSDTQTRAAPDERWCWFAGDDGTAEAAAQFADAETRNVVRVPQTAVQVGKRSVRYFISYAHAETTLKTKLVSLLGQWFDSAKDYAFIPWQDGDILVGSDWHDQIQQAIKASDFGLLLVSPAFLASRYITREELRHFIAPDPLGENPDRLAVPVALCGLRFDGSMDMKGLERRQIFRDAAGKAFEERSTGKPRKDFVSDLFGKIVQRLDAHFAAPPPPAEPKRRPEIWQRDDLARDLAETKFVAPHGRTGTMNKLDEEAPGGDRKDAVQFLLDWAREPNGPSCCALLGSVGIGKTTTSKAFAHRLLRDREADPSLPMPIYLDLRNLGEAAKQEPDLKAILHTVLRRSWQGGATDLPLEAEEVIRLVRQEAAIVIFDGLDEVLVHLSQLGGQQFTRELLRILPPGLWPGRRRAEEPGRPGRVMLTCRTHYFRSLREQQTHLTLEDRDEVTDTDYRVFILLPFEDDQIRAYLTQYFQNREVEPIMETIEAVHNLKEMATRPYTLNLIARSLPQIERWQMEGRRVTGVDLYRHMVQSWLERDSGKHEFDIDHKQRIMEHVAAALWRSGGRTWTARQMEDWLAGFMDATPEVAQHYRGKDLDLLKKDLRTATFLIGGGGRDFGFAHSSLQEFFLAAYMLRALRQARVEDWNIARPGRETFDFLCQMLLGETDDKASKTLRGIGSNYRQYISENAFYFILFGLAHDYPLPQPAGFVLDGIDLRFWMISGKAANQLLDLRRVSFRGALLNGTVFRYIDLDDADFTDANLFRAEVIAGYARRARFDRAALQGAVFRNLDLCGASFDAAIAHRTQFLRCATDTLSGLDVSPPTIFSALCRPALIPAVSTGGAPHLTILDGHSGPVWTSAFSPDGSRIASGSEDLTLRLWDAASGDCLMTLNGHGGPVWTCAFSPNGNRIASGSNDQTLRVWDAASGHCLMTLRGHEGPIHTCAISPDGSRIASGSDDHTLRVWDAANGTCRRLLRGHDGVILGCAFSPDGSRITSWSRDSTIRLWDATSGACLKALAIHAAPAWTCAFSPDGSRIALGSDDRKVRVLDAASGDCLTTLHGHEGSVRTCIFSSDGSRIASGSRDGSLRLWTVANGEPLLTLRGYNDRGSTCVFSPDGGRIVSGSDDGTLLVWDAANGDRLMTLGGRKRSLLACVFSSDGRRIASGSEDRTLKVWDAASGDCLMTARGHTDYLSTCTFAPNGSRIASGSGDGTVRVWDTANGDCLMTLSGHKAPVQSCAFSPDGSRIASGSEDRTLRVWDAISGKCLMTLQVCDAASGYYMVKFMGHKEGVQACAFSPDGSEIASGSVDYRLRLWDAATGDCLMTLHGHERPILACSFSPDGGRIVSGSADGTLRVWDASSGNCLITLHGHEGPVSACAFSPDGKCIASGANDRRLRLWDAASGDCLITFDGHEGPVLACAFSPDGSHIASGSADGSLRLWYAASGESIGFQAHILSHGGVATLSADGTRVLFANEEAWRDLAWLVPDATGALTRYPAETFGPLPRMTA